MPAEKIGHEWESRARGSKNRRRAGFEVAISKAAAQLNMRGSLPAPVRSFTLDQVWRQKKVAAVRAVRQAGMRSLTGKGNLEEYNQ
jgi:hypothetical protein